MPVDLEKLEEHFEDAPHDIALSDIDLKTLPRHISCIMDGNGRWANERGLPRAEGHRAGIGALREIITTAVRLGIDVLSVYAFSTENWKRPKHEVNLLMHLFATTFLEELPLLQRERVRVVFLGDLSALPRRTQEVFEQGLAACSEHDGMVLALAVNYGARAEIVRAARLLAVAAQLGELDPATIDEELFAQKLYTNGLPDPELVIRTSGEMRLSNYLLYQLAYAELYVTDMYWPDFNRWGFLRALASYQHRDRRFGGISVSKERP
ncbi:isoprenyl transferase [Collinsella sp. AGMB00827]|uniref:Isoprenyl transferase n=1 Tax=Collinsella ureilytica TaxID=2869515 RepID=A0ABS7MNQ9_9ACTN|nr:isoprenyl transferase [Collinsella urealyticum]MBY4798035.1 isoprenyl transferase [Collinsella urealyticum]